jgi:hypothetical protein
VKNIFTVVVGGTLLLAVGGLLMAILAAVVTWAWNLAAPTLGAPALTFPAAFGILVVLYVFSLFLKRPSK